MNSRFATVLSLLLVLTNFALAKDRLLQGEYFKKGERLTSQNGKFILVFQTNGKLVLYQDTVGQGKNIGFVGPNEASDAVQALMARDGNFCISNGTRNIWCEYRNGENTNPSNRYLHVDNNGGVFLRSQQGNEIARTIIPPSLNVASSAQQTSAATASLVRTGVVKQHKRKKLGDWRGAKGTANFYRDGRLVIETNAWTDKEFVATRANVFAVLVDGASRSIFVTPEFEIKTAYAKGDPTGPSDVTQTFNVNVPEALAPYVDSIDLYFYDRGSGNYWSSRVQSLNAAIKAYDELDPRAKAAIEGAAKAYMTGGGGG